MDSMYLKMYHSKVNAGLKIYNMGNMYVAFVARVTKRCLYSVTRKSIVQR